MASWHQGKLFIEHAVSIAMTSLHLIVGVLVWIVVALVSRRPLTGWVPWAWTFAFIFWNETVDLSGGTLARRRDAIRRGSQGSGSDDALANAADDRCTRATGSVSGNASKAEALVSPAGFEPATY